MDDSRLFLCTVKLTNSVFETKLNQAVIKFWLDVGQQKRMVKGTFLKTLTREQVQLSVRAMCYESLKCCTAKKEMLTLAAMCFSFLFFCLRATVVTFWTLNHYYTIIYFFSILYLLRRLWNELLTMSGMCSRLFWVECWLPSPWLHSVYNLLSGGLEIFVYVNLPGFRKFLDLLF